MTEEIVSLVDPEPPDRYRFDYKGRHRYIIHLPVHAGKQVFVRQERVVAVLNCLRDAALRHRFDVYAYCLLPDEMIIIVRGKDDTAEMKTFLAEFRRASSKELEAELGHPLWKKKYLERVLRKKEDTRQIADGIFQKPVKAGLAKHAAEYPFQGSFVVIPKSPRS
jgi:REP element-mobilizing transposase RayT